MDVDGKENILRIMANVEHSFSKYWSDYPPFMDLRERTTQLRTILESEEGTGTGKNTFYHYGAEIPIEEIRFPMAILNGHLELFYYHIW